MDTEKDLINRIEQLNKEADIMLNTDKLHERAELYTSIQNQAKAINDYVAILKINPDDRYAKTRLDMLRTIVRLSNTDIYANPNTNLDPWLE